jgi:hypothetical protein
MTMYRVVEWSSDRVIDSRESPRGYRGVKHRVAHRDRTVFGFGLRNQAPIPCGLLYFPLHSRLLFRLLFGCYFDLFCFNY